MFIIFEELSLKQIKKIIKVFIAANEKCFLLKILLLRKKVTIFCPPTHTLLPPSKKNQLYFYEQSCLFPMTKAFSEIKTVLWISQKERPIFVYEHKPFEFIRNITRNSLFSMSFWIKVNVRQNKSRANRNTRVD